MNSVPIKTSSSRPYLLRALYEWMVDNELTPFIIVDTTIAGVRVPPAYIKNGQITLNLAPQAVSHFHWDNSSLQFRAGFSGSIFEVLMPIKAILAIFAKENGEGMSFDAIPGDAGDDDDDGDFTPQPPTTPSTSTDEKPKRGSHLKVVK